MLPLTRINLNTICTDASGLKGDVFLFEWNTVIEECKKESQSLDRFLTIRIASYINNKKYKIPMLILFGPAEDSFKLTICTKGNVNFSPCLHSSAGMAGYVEHCSEYVASSARCFLYFTGEKLLRTYQPLEWPLGGETFASDFGSQFGLNVFLVDKEFYDRLVSYPTENPTYSFVPDHEKESIISPISNSELHLAFISFK